MNRRIFFLSVFFFSLFFTFLPSSTNAATNASFIPCGKNKSDDPSEMKPCTICHIIVGGSRIITWGLSIMTVIAITVIVAMAILYIVSAGDAGMMATAKGGIKASLIGFAVMLGAWLIIMTVLKVMSADIPGLGVNTTGFTFTCDTTSTTVIK